VAQRRRRDAFIRGSMEAQTIGPQQASSTVQK
jgi:hypothetical protein